MQQLGLHHGLVLLLQQIFISTTWDRGRVVLLLVVTISLINVAIRLLLVQILVQAHLADGLCAGAARVSWISAIRTLLAVVDHVGCRQYVSI